MRRRNKMPRRWQDRRVVRTGLRYTALRLRNVAQSYAT